MRHWARSDRSRPLEREPKPVANSTAPASSQAVLPISWLTVTWKQRALYLPPFLTQKLSDHVQLLLIIRSFDNDAAKCWHFWTSDR